MWLGKNFVWFDLDSGSVLCTVCLFVGLVWLIAMAVLTAAVKLVITHSVIVRDFRGNVSFTTRKLSKC